jgi:hypothetical protein
MMEVGASILGSNGCPLLSSSPSPSRLSSANVASSSITRNSTCRSWRKSENSHGLSWVLTHSSVMPFYKTSPVQSWHSSNKFRCLASSASSEEISGAPAEEQDQNASSSSTGQKEEKKDEDLKKKRPKEFKSSWEAKDSEGNDYLYRLGSESANMNINVGARAGMIDHIFVGNFLGKDGEQILFDGLFYLRRLDFFN